MSQEILFDVTLDRQSEWYGTLAVSNIHIHGHSGVKVDNYLCVKFNAPAIVTSTDFTYSTNPWVDITADITSQQINASTYLIIAKVQFSNAYTFNGEEIFTLGINGDLDNTSGKPYTETFILAADQIPNQTVVATAQVSPQHLNRN